MNDDKEKKCVWKILHPMELRNFHGDTSCSDKIDLSINFCPFCGGKIEKIYLKHGGSKECL